MKTRTATLALALLAVPTTADAQARPLLGALEPAREAALARSAATPDIGEHASVWVMGERGYERWAEGTNGWTCLVERDHPESLAPQCYDPEGTRTIVPGVRRIEELRAGGMDYRAATARVEAEYASGALPRPSRPVLSYMLSREQRLFATPEGPEVGAWKPHVMVYHPWFSSEGMALPDGGLAMVGGLGTGGIFTYLVFPVADWSDGTPAR